MDTSENLRRKAEQCLRLARQGTSETAVLLLRELAREYIETAERMERAARAAETPRDC
jgi:hypothetical protein